MSWNDDVRVAADVPLFTEDKKMSWNDDVRVAADVPLLTEDKKMSWNDDVRVAADVPAAGSRRAEGGGGPQAPHQGQARTQGLLSQRTVFHRYENYFNIKHQPKIFLVVNLVCL
jgi:hypothetical protein